MRYILKERLWLTADEARAVPDGHPEARYLLGAAGRDISEALALQLGLLEKDEEAEPQKGEPKKDDKAKQPGGNKGRIFPPEVKDQEGSRRLDLLPDDFPALEHLHKARLFTYTAVRALDDLTAIRGIGAATAKKIREALES